MSLDALRGIWKGRTAVCIASGPSLTAEDVERAKVHEFAQDRSRSRD